jgi:hypothetical protein
MQILKGRVEGECNSTKRDDYFIIYSLYIGCLPKPRKEESIELNHSRFGIKRHPKTQTLCHYWNWLEINSFTNNGIKIERYTLHSYFSVFIWWILFFFTTIYNKEKEKKKVEMFHSLVAGMKHNNNNNNKKRLWNVFLEFSKSTIINTLLDCSMNLIKFRNPLLHL